MVFRMSADVGSFVGLGDSGGGGSGPLAPSPFRLPAAYEEAKERKVSAVSDLRNAVKAVRPCDLPKLCSSLMTSMDRRTSCYRPGKSMFCTKSAWSHFGCLGLAHNVRRTILRKSWTGSYLSAMLPTVNG